MPKNILIADDDPDFLTLLKIRLMNEGYDIDTACDGQEVIDKICRGGIDLIIMDISMPKLNGFDVCKIIRNGEKFKDTPIIIVTGAAKDAVSIKNGMDLGAVSYIQKPYKPDVLLGIIKGSMG
jgi:two-component system response regulator VanR